MNQTELETKYPILKIPHAQLLKLIPKACELYESFLCNGECAECLGE